MQTMSKARKISIHAAVLSAAAILCGCFLEQEEVSPGPAFARPVTLAVAPVLNFSGEFDFDPLKAADLLASELSYVEGIVVLPVNRVFAYLATQGKTQIESPAHALSVAEAVGADAILVPGITEYDAYTPVVGVLLQMYGPSTASSSTFDAISASRYAQGFDISSMSDPLAPTSQVQKVYNAAHQKVRDQVEKFAKPRSAEENSLGWRQYLKVQTLFLRFCWHDAIINVMRQERSRHRLVAEGPGIEEPA